MHGVSHKSINKHNLLLQPSRESQLILIKHTIQIHYLCIFFLKESSQLPSAQSGTVEVMCPWLNNRGDSEGGAKSDIMQCLSNSGGKNALHMIYTVKKTNKHTHYRLWCTIHNSLYGVAMLLLIIRLQILRRSEINTIYWTRWTDTWALNSDKVKMASFSCRQVRWGRGCEERCWIEEFCATEGVVVDVVVLL